MKKFVVSIEVQRRSGDGSWTVEEWDVEAASGKAAKALAEERAVNDRDLNYWDVMDAEEVFVPIILDEYNRPEPIVSKPQMILPCRKGYEY